MKVEDYSFGDDHEGDRQRIRPWYTYKDSKSLGKATAEPNEDRFGKPDLAPKIDLDEE